MSQQAMSSQIINCPKCKLAISFTRINSHLDTCLGDTNETPQPLKNILTGRVIKPPSLTRNKGTNTIASGNKGFNTFTSGSKASGFLSRNNTIAKKGSSFKIENEVFLSDDDKNELSGINLKEEEKEALLPVFETMFEDPTYLRKIQTLPLFEKLKPQCLKTFIGQGHLLNKENGIIYKHLTQTIPNIPNMILFGPPSIGKTSLVTVLLNELNKTEKSKWKMFQLSGVTLSTTELKQIIEKSINDFKNWKVNTIIFIDEIHRLNKLQQDSLLKIAEMGNCRLIGCTTENPSFKINNAVLSRLDVFVLKPYLRNERWQMFEQLVKMQLFYKPDVYFESEDIKKKIFDKVLALSEDNRRFISVFENIYLFAKSNIINEETFNSLIESDAFKDILYYNTDSHYELISAFHKSVRGSDSNAALYYMFKMLKSGCDPLYICRRMIRIASEDVGIVNNQLLVFANTTYDSCMKLGMPESDVILAHCCVLLCESPKSVKIYRAMNKIKAALDSVPTYRDGAVPLHLRNAPTKLMTEMGYKEGYKYNPDYVGGDVGYQEYFPSSFYNGKGESDSNEIEKLKTVYDDEQHLG
ncbi:hypothetical protein QEN19_004265 [Hanseniaspora menglaensis]